jgi:hypothetical protein
MRLSYFFVLSYLLSSLIVYFFSLPPGIKPYIVHCGSTVRSVLNMRAGQYALHFIINDELLPHAKVKSPDGESAHMGDRTQLRRIECEWEGFQHAAL